MEKEVAAEMKRELDRKLKKMSDHDRFKAFQDMT